MLDSLQRRRKFSQVCFLELCNPQTSYPRKRYTFLHTGKTGAKAVQNDLRVILTLTIQVISLARRVMCQVPGNGALQSSSFLALQIGATVQTGRANQICQNESGRSGQDGTSGSETWYACCVFLEKFVDQNVRAEAARH